MNQSGSSLSWLMIMFFTFDLTSVLFATLIPFSVWFKVVIIFFIMAYTLMKNLCTATLKIGNVGPNLFVSS